MDHNRLTREPDFWDDGHLFSNEAAEGAETPNIDALADFLLRAQEVPMWHIRDRSDDDGPQWFAEDIAYATECLGMSESARTHLMGLDPPAAKRVLVRLVGFQIDVARQRLHAATNMRQERS